MALVSFIVVLRFFPLSVFFFVGRPLVVLVEVQANRLGASAANPSWALASPGDRTHPGRNMRTWEEHTLRQERPPATVCFSVCH